MGKEKEVSQQLEVMDGYVVELSKFYKMSESDWVILRLVADRGSDFINDTQDKAVLYLAEKYTQDLIRECFFELMEESEA